MQVARSSTLITTGTLAAVIGAGVAVIGAEATPVGPVLGLVPAVLTLLIGLRRPLRRWRVAQRPFPDRQRDWLAAHVPLYAQAGPEARRRFERDVQFALDEYSYEGVQDVAVTEARRLAVAAGIATLLHGRPSWELPGTSSVLFYPDAFDDDYYGGDYADYDGMAHEQGPIILAAPAVDESWETPGDGSNVVLHELAHLFDFQNAGSDGVPSLVDPSSAAAWQALVKREMRKVRRGRSMLRPYAAEAPSEFFAVAVEVFFERPAEMARRHPELYDALVAFFALDPRPDAADDHTNTPDRNASSEETPGEDATDGDASDTDVATGERTSSSLT